jgi:hypothetical protein
MNQYLRHFQSLKDWINYSEQNQSEDAPPAQRSSCNGNPSFTGVRNKAESYHLLKTGYPLGLQKMKQILQGIHNTVTLISPQYEFADDVQGSAPNIEAFLQGSPEDMFYLSPVEKDAPPSFIKLQFDLTASAYITTEQMFWAGATVFAAMEVLHAQGCSTEMCLTHTTSNDRDVWQSMVPIPNNIDLDTLSFLLTHASVLRVIVFSMMEHESSEIRQQFSFYKGGSYSSPFLLKSPSCDVMLSIARLCQEFSNNEQSNLQRAQTILKHLVDSKFEKFR